MRIASVVNSSVDTVIERFDQAKSIVQRYNNFLTLKDRYSAPDLMLQVLMGELDVDAITRGVKDALVDAKKWIEDLNRFFNWNPTRDTLREYQVLFTGTGLKEIEINWVQFRKDVDDNKARICNYVLPGGGHKASLNDYDEVKTGMESMTKLILEIKAQAAPVVEDRPRNRDRDHDPDRESSRAKYGRIRNTLATELKVEFQQLMTRHEIAVAGGSAQEYGKLELDENQDKTKLMINDGFLNTYEDLKKNDPEWKQIEIVRTMSWGEERNVNTFQAITDMRNRLEEREEVFKEKKKDLQIKKSNQLKIIEEQLKEGNRVIYKERKDFIAWAYDMKLFMQSFPDEIDDSMKMGFIRRTIEDAETKEALKICTTSTEMLNAMAARHVDDKNLIVDLFKPVYSANLPTNYVKCFKNIEIVLRCLNLLESMSKSTSMMSASGKQSIKTGSRSGWITQSQWE